jgi:hypothetical protein
MSIRPHLPYYDGPIQYLDHQYPAVRENLQAQYSTDSYGTDLEEQGMQNVGCQTDYRVQSAQTDPAEVGEKLRKTFSDFDTIYPEHWRPFTVKTISLIERGLNRRGLRKHLQADHSLDDPAQKMKHFVRLENEKWEFRAAEVQE